jgi:antitoxin component YwqK of YwqJK toxin-antitoxin module
MILICLENKFKCLKIHNECFYDWNKKNNVCCINCKRKLELEQEFEYKEDNGFAVQQCYLKNGKTEGEYKMFIKGILRTHCYYKNGLLDGEYKKYDGWRKKPVLVVHCYYKNGKQEGEYKDYYEGSGNLCRHCYHVDGKMDGEYKTWYRDGTLYEHCYYENGVKIKKIK